MDERIVILGAGQAAGQAVVSLRQLGHAGPITVLGDERYPPYQRPPLSKKFLAGDLEVERLYVKPEGWYAEKGATLRLGCPAESLDVAGHRVRMADGNHVDYDRLLVCTGSAVRRIPVPEVNLPGIHYLRTIDDVRAIQPSLREGARLVVVGGGYIGLEVAAIARELGLDVTVVEMADRVMARVVCPEISAFYQALHEAAGVRLRLGTPVQGFEGGDRVQGVRVSAGEVLPADLVIIGAGIVPVTGIAADAGLTCDDGICVDEYAATSAAHVYAAGDCTRHPNALLGRRLRLESVHNALEQARTAAASLCGQPRAYTQLPWFWSDQYDVKLQIAGLTGEHDRVVVRGDPEQRSFSACYLRDDLLLAVDAVNQPRDFMQAKKLLADGPVRVNLARLADASASLRDAAED